MMNRSAGVHVDEPLVVSMLIVSSAHVTAEEAEVLNACRYGHGAYGWLLYVADGADEALPAEIHAPSEGLLRAVEFAISHQCSYLLLDRDADKLPGVTSYDWLHESA